MPGLDEVLHVRDSSGFEYLTLEGSGGVPRITAGNLRCFAAEIASPSFSLSSKFRFFPQLESYFVFLTMLHRFRFICGNLNILQLDFHWKRYFAARARSPTSG